MKMSFLSRVRARCSYGKSVRLSVRLSNAGMASKLWAQYFHDLVGQRSSTHKNFFFLHLCYYYYLLFKAASLDGDMAFLVAVHCVIFLLVLILYTSLENKMFFFFF